MNDSTTNSTLTHTWRGQIHTNTHTRRAQILNRVWNRIPREVKFIPESETANLCDIENHVYGGGGFWVSGEVKFITDTEPFNFLVWVKHLLVCAGLNEKLKAQTNLRGNTHTQSSPGMRRYEWIIKRSAKSKKEYAYQERSDSYETHTRRGHIHTRV